MSLVLGFAADAGFCVVVAGFWFVLAVWVAGMFCFIIGMNYLICV